MERASAHLSSATRLTGLLLAPPLLSLDVFSYISYARLGAGEGLNPYDAVPADLVGDPTRGRLDPGLRGDLTIVDDGLQVVAVGALHLYGDDNLPEMLKKP